MTSSPSPRGRGVRAPVSRRGGGGVTVRAIRSCSGSHFDEERAFGVDAIAAAHDPGKAVAAALERSRAQIVGLEGKQNGDGEARPGRQRLPLRVAAEGELQSDIDEKEHDELDPHAVIEQPHERHEKRGPGEALSDEGEPVRARDHVRRSNGRLIYGIDSHGHSRSLRRRKSGIL